MKTVILGGGNVGDVHARLDEAERLMAERTGEIVARSSFYASRAWGFEAESDFVNRAWVVDTPLAPEALLDTLQEIENRLGRDRKTETEQKARSGERYTSRTMDLDILFYGEEHISGERLTIPHPLIMERDFVLDPLGEVLHMTREEIGKMILTIETK